jgi:hypothetical protein
MNNKKGKDALMERIMMINRKAAEIAKRNLKKDPLNQ